MTDLKDYAATTTGSIPYSDVVMSSAQEFGISVAGFLPKFIGALVIFIIGLMIAKALRGLVKKILSAVGFGKMVQFARVDDALKNVGMTKSVSDMLAQIFYWVVLLIAIMGASNVMGLTAVSSTIKELIAYIPNVIAAMIIIMIVIAVGRVIKDMIVASMSQFSDTHAKTIGSVVNGIIIIFGSIIALSQLGIDVSILTANTTIILTGLVVTFVLSFGLSSRNVVENLIGGYYVRKHYATGQDVTVAGVRGKVKSLTSVAMIVDASEGDIAVPYSKVISEGSGK